MCVLERERGRGGGSSSFCFEKIREATKET